MNKIKYRNLKVEKEIQEAPLHLEAPDTEPEDEIIEEYFGEDPKIFLLNNLLMSVQFFENYEREIENLRENWYKEFSLLYHHKKCFYADSLFRVIGTQVKFQPRHGVNKDTEALLHPLRMFISNDNVQAVYDPAAFNKVQPQIKPFYQLIVKPCDDNKKEKSGYVSLVEYKIIEEPESKTPTTKTPPSEPPLRQSLYVPRDNEIFKRNSMINLKRKSTFDLKNSRALTKTEKLIALIENKNLAAAKPDRNSKFLDNPIEDTIPNDGFYNYLKSEARLKFKSIHDIRMNNVPETSIRIPKSCFQAVDVKKKLNARRRSANTEDSCFTTKNYLNSAAYKAHFCDLLIEKLVMPLNLDPDCLNESFVLEEYIALRQKGIQSNIIPVISILDWNQHIKISKNLNERNEELEWPTSQMSAIINILPCYLVPKGYFRQYEENVDYEKEWKMIFPKAEEFLLLHMMHSQLRCYFFVLTIYKTFFEYETNPASFGPRHLLHLLLWLVHKDFLAWPEDRPGETLLKYFRVLYKKLQNKSLRDFFINQRNLFHDSLLKDLHKAQAIVKRILENPLLYVMRAMRNLHLQPDFYPMLDITKLNEMLKEIKPPPKKTKKREQPKTSNLKSQEGEPKIKIQKTVRFEEDAERQWKKNAIKQINREKKMEEEERLRSMSIDTINIEELPKLALDKTKYFQTIEIFIHHFLEMGAKSVEYKTLNQALMYLNQVQKLVTLFPVNKSTIVKLRGFEKKMVELKQKCDKLISNPIIKEISKQPTDKKEIQLKDVEIEPEIEIIERRENVSISSKNSESDEECSTKL